VEGLEEELRAQLAAESAAEAEQMAAAAATSLGAGGGAGLEAAELAIRAAMTKVGASLLAGLLAADAGYRGPAVECGAGHLAQFVSYRDKTFGTALGPVTVNRAWYHCRVCGAGLAPRDAELGVAGDTMSRGLAKMTARAAAAGPFTAGSGLLADLAGIRVSARRIERHAEAGGTAAAALITAQAAGITAGAVIPLPAAGLPDKLYIAIDGTGVPVVRAAAEGRAGKGEDGIARTREVKLACVFTQTRVDDDGYPVRDPDSSSYLATFEPAAPFGVLMAAEARRRGAARVRQLTILGDGAAWIWNLAAEHFPEATQIVDLYHAREHLHDLGKLLAFMTGDTSSDWLAARSAELDAGDIGAITAAARVFPLTGVKAQDRDRALGYFENNAPPHALQPLPHLRPVRRLRRCRSRLQSSHRANAETIRHALVSARRHRHPHPALPASKRPMGRDLATAAQPDTARRPPPPGKLILLPTKLTRTRPHSACRDWTAACGRPSAECCRRRPGLWVCRGGGLAAGSGRLRGSGSCPRRWRSRR